MRREDQLNQTKAETTRTLAGSTGDKKNTTEYAPMLVNARKAATMLDIGSRSLWSYTNCNAIPSRRIGRAVRYCPIELRAWIAQGCPTTPGSANRVREWIKSGGVA